MKLFQPLLIGTASLFTITQAYVVDMFSNADCTGDVTSRNVYDNTCAYTNGFQSLKMTAGGGQFQQLTAYSRQACAGPSTFSGCAAGINSIAIGECHQTTNSDGGSNALSSYSNAAPCPN